jgi:hypothetical protein
MIKRAEAAAALDADPVIGEPETPARSEDQIVRRDQPVIDRLELSCRELETLDRAAAMARRRRSRNGEPVLVAIGESAAIDRDPDRPVRADRGAVGAGLGLGENFPAAVRSHPGQPGPADLGEDHRAVGHRHRPLREFQAFGDKFELQLHDMSLIVMLNLIQHP